MPFTQQKVSLLIKDSLFTKHADPLGMAQNAPKLQRGFPARCQSSAPQTNTFNLTVKLDFSTLPLRLWGRRSIPCHSLSCKSGGNWHLRCSLSKWENTRVHSERCCFPSTLSAELSISENRIKFLIFLFVFSAFPAYGVHTRQDNGALARIWEKEQVHRRQFAYSSVRTTV